ncbi:MAG TPA: GNAT family N-acetyltransferase [Candidatus Binataceae bacterium]
MNVTLKPIDRGNWREMLALELAPEQQSFVTQPPLTFARCYVRLFGDNFEHTPMVICGGGRVVGYVTIACNPASERDYWIDDIMIDRKDQSRGYGRAAMREIVAYILARYPRCAGIRLTCFRTNKIAAALYTSLGFLPTGGLDEEHGEPDYELSGPALAAFR